MRKDGRNELLSCCFSYIDDLSDMVDNLDEELERIKIDNDYKDHQIEEFKNDNAELISINNELKMQKDAFQKSLKAANTCVDNLTDKIGAIRQIIIDNIMCGVDSDGNDEMFVTVDEIGKAFSKLCDLLDITEGDYCKND